jgi:Domain of unknown function (DUF397)
VALFTESAAGKHEAAQPEKGIEMTKNGIWREFEFRCDGGAGCVMVERVAGCILIWDSKNPHGPRLVFSKKEYADFRRRVRDRAWPRAALRFMTSLIRLVSFGVHQLAS